MDKKQTKEGEVLSLPVLGTVIIGTITGLVSGASFTIIKHWPLPASVAPVFGFEGGFVWGAVIGGVSGLILGFLTDDQHFTDSPKS